MGKFYLNCRSIWAAILAAALIVPAPAALAGVQEPADQAPSSYFETLSKTQKADLVSVWEALDKDEPPSVTSLSETRIASSKL